jgi:hypothetical protein
MYSLSLPVSAIRTKIRQEFERHRYANQLPVVDVLITKSNAEFQVRSFCRYGVFSFGPYPWVVDYTGMPSVSSG